MFNKCTLLKSCSLVKPVLPNAPGHSSLVHGLAAASWSPQGWILPRLQHPWKGHDWWEDGAGGAGLFSAPQDTQQQQEGLLPSPAGVSVLGEAAAAALGHALGLCLMLLFRGAAGGNALNCVRKALAAKEKQL